MGLLSSRSVGRLRPLRALISAGARPLSGSPHLHLILAAAGLRATASPHLHLTLAAVAELRGTASQQAAVTDSLLPNPTSALRLAEGTEHRPKWEAPRWEQVPWEALRWVAR